MKVLLRGGVLMLAAVFAFAFTEPKVESNNQLFGNLNGTWVPIPDQPPGPSTYACEDSQNTCVAKFQNDIPDMDNVIPGTLIEGTYRPN